MDGKGLPLAFVLAPGQSHELIFAEEALNNVCVHTRKPGPPLRRPHALAGDKGYSAGWLREWMKAKNIEDVVPTKSNEKRNERFDKEKYKRRNVVERSIGWLKESRRIATRYDKLALSFSCMLCLAQIATYLR